MAHAYENLVNVSEEEHDMLSRVWESQRRELIASLESAQTCEEAGRVVAERTSAWMGVDSVLAFFAQRDASGDISGVSLYWVNPYTGMVMSTFGQITEAMLADHVRALGEHTEDSPAGLRGLDDRLASLLPAGFLRTARPEWITALQRDESEVSDEVLEMLLMLDRAQRLMDGLNEAAEGAPARFETVMNAVTEGIGDDLLEKYGQARERDIAEADDAEDPA